MNLIYTSPKTKITNANAPFEDVSHIEHGDVPLSYSFSGVYMVIFVDPCVSTKVRCLFRAWHVAARFECAERRVREDYHDRHKGQRVDHWIPPPKKKTTLAGSRSTMSAPTVTIF